MRKIASQHLIQVSERLLKPFDEREIQFCCCLLWHEDFTFSLDLLMEFLFAGLYNYMYCQNAGLYVQT